MTTLRRLINRALGRHNDRVNISNVDNRVIISITCGACGPIHTEYIHRDHYSWARVGKAMDFAETRHHGRKNR